MMIPLCSVHILLQHSQYHVQNWTLAGAAAVLNAKTKIIFILQTVTRQTKESQIFGIARISPMLYQKDNFSQNMNGMNHFPMPCQSTQCKLLKILL